MHARITLEEDDYVLEDLGSRHGTYLNGQKVARSVLKNGDRVDFGFHDSYKLIFQQEESGLQRILEHISPGKQDEPSRGLGRLRALVEVARALQTSLSTQDVLGAVIDAALAITRSERGFLLLKKADDLDIAVARDLQGRPLPATDLRVPTTLIHRALHYRRELLSMNFDPLEQQGVKPDLSVAGLELRSVICIPLVKIRGGNIQDTLAISSVSDTVGLIYMDSRHGTADLSSGNREILQTLALEASTILENARLLDEEREKQRLEQELDIAREIQRSLFPKSLPSEGWFRAAGSSVPSIDIGGDYFDIRKLADSCWATVVADVSGKGVSSALLAALLQGAFFLASDAPELIEKMMASINSFLLDRTQGEKYATMFYCAIGKSGMMTWSNAGHCAPLLLSRTGEMRKLHTTGMPLGLLKDAHTTVEQSKLQPGDKIIAYSDGLSDAEDADGQPFSARLHKIVSERPQASARCLHDELSHEVQRFTEGSRPNDDLTLLVIEYAPEGR